MRRRSSLYIEICFLEFLCVIWAFEKLANRFPFCNNTRSLPFSKHSVRAVIFCAFHGKTANALAAREALFAVAAVVDGAI